LVDGEMRASVALRVTQRVSVVAAAIGFYAPGAM